MEQKRFSFDTCTIIKILKGAAIAGSAVVLTYLAENIGQLSFGQYTGIVVGILSILINALKEWVRGMPAK